MNSSIGVNDWKRPHPANFSPEGSLLFTTTNIDSAGCHSAMPLGQSFWLVCDNFLMGSASTSQSKCDNCQRRNYRAPVCLSGNSTWYTALSVYIHIHTLLCTRQGAFQYIIINKYKRLNIRDESKLRGDTAKPTCAAHPDEGRVWAPPSPRSIPHWNAPCRNASAMPSLYLLLNTRREGICFKARSISLHPHNYKGKSVALWTFQNEGFAAWFIYFPC